MSSASIQVGEVVAHKYRIEGIIGEGAMGMVVSAMHVGLQQRVAIKFLLSNLAEKEASAERFRREALAAASIRGEHACRVLDVGTHDNGVPYIVMEHLDGHTLATEIEQRGPIPFQEAIGFVLEACEALAEAHVLGIVHRDVKPANLFLADSVGGIRTLKVLDFGVAKSLSYGTGGQAALTKTASFVGSPLYTSPEQLHSVKDLDARSDVWSLGVVLYELITGRAPFMGESIAELIAAILYRDPPPLSGQGIVLPSELVEVVGCALAKQREDRYATVGELADALAQFVPEEGALSAERVYRVLATTQAREGGRLNSLPLRTAAERGAEATRLTSERRAKRTGSSSANRASDTVDSPARKRALLAIVAVLLLVGAGYVLSTRLSGAERETNTGTAGAAAPPLPTLPPRVEAPLAAPPEAVPPTGVLPPEQELEPAPTPGTSTPTPNTPAAARVAPAAAVRRPLSPRAQPVGTVGASSPARVLAPATPATDAPPSDGKVRLRDYGGRR
ncbi:MAG: hypothetical protein RLZZ450_5056 [Pseudomonadota bacterium]|jgi:serine/threonine-protein kinase